MKLKTQQNQESHEPSLSNFSNLSTNVSTNLAAALDETVEAAICSHISEAELTALLLDRLHKKTPVAAMAPCSSSQKILFHPDAGP